MVNLPQANEIEVSIFGRGKGESIAVHIGHGKWLIIDSHLLPGTKTPVALNYLSEIGVDLGADIVAIVCTHWHDDHIQGIFEIFNCAISADFYCSTAFTTQELGSN